MDAQPQLPLPRTSPENVGLCSERLKRVGMVIRDRIERRSAAGGVAVAARRGRIPYFESFGMMDAEKQIPMRGDAIFRVYSMTKPIMAVATMMLYEECAFFLDEPASNILPPLADMKVAETTPDGTGKLVDPRRPITIHDLLTHTSGLTYEPAHDAEEDNIDLDAFIARLPDYPLSFHPGEKWQYSSASDVLGALVQKVADRPLDEFLQERIFKPLGMTDTGFRVPEGERDRLVKLYAHDENGEIVPMEEDRPYSGESVFLSGGGGLVSTTPDYLRFGLMLLNRGEFDGARLLSPKTVDLMTVNHLPPEIGCIEPFKFGYGLGVSVLRSLAEKQSIGSVGEFGWGGAASTDFWADPQEEMVTLVMMQVKPGVSARATKKVKQAFYQAIVE